MSAQNFVDPFDSMYSYGSIPEEYTGMDSIGGKIGQAFGIVDKNEYQYWLDQQDKMYERAAVSSARAWDEYMDSTKYQRMVKDLEAAGLNPWLALQSGLSAGGGSSTASTGSSARNHAKNESKSTLGSLAMLLLATAKLLSMAA